jgi:hypothetical protein
VTAHRNPKLDWMLYEGIITRERFSADDVTLCGELTAVEGNTQGNGPQGSIGPMFADALDKGYVIEVDWTRSKNPRRKSGKIGVYEGTDKGEVAAAEYFRTHENPFADE